MDLNTYLNQPQEYLNGKEYVIDTISRDGEHKVLFASFGTWYTFQ